MIDLIIPMYNAEEHIDKLFGSICAQTKEHAAIITVVNDHCTDNSIEKVKQWRDFTGLPITILTPPEKIGWPGLVRQYGIEHTKAEHIMFLDSDDELLPQAFDYLSYAIKSTNADIVISHFVVETGDLRDYEQGIQNGGFTWLHGNIYKRKFLEDNNIKFKAGYNEDGTFNLKCLLLSNDIYECDKQTYIWHNNKSSITRSTKHYISENLEDIIGGYLGTYSDYLNTILPNLNKEERYLKLLERNKENDRYWSNAIGHLGLMFKWYNDFIAQNEDKQAKEKLINLGKRFVDETMLDLLYNQDFVEDVYKAALSKRLPIIQFITLNQFLNLLGVYLDLRSEKIIRTFGGSVV